MIRKSTIWEKTIVIIACRLVHKSHDLSNIGNYFRVSCFLFYFGIFNIGKNTLFFIFCLHLLTLNQPPKNT